MKFHECNVWKRRNFFRYVNRTSVDSFLLFYLIKYLQPTRILEIGIKEGWTVGLYLESSPHSKIDGVDVDLKLMKLSSVLDSLEKFMVIQQDSKNINFDYKFDFINVDGDHSYDYAVNDIEKALKYISPNGIIMIDDISHPGVEQACKEFISSDKLQPIFQTGQSLYCIKPGENVVLFPYFVDLNEKTKDFIRWEQSKLDKYDITSISADAVWTSYPDFFDHLLQFYNL